MATSIRSLLVALVGAQVVFAAIPSYIKVCKRNEPEMGKCITNSIEALRPRLVKGIPELDIPPMEPMVIDELVVSSGGPFRAVGKNVVIRGISKLEIKEIKADVKKLVYDVKVFIPFVTFDAEYDVNAKILSLNLQGNGPLSANTTDVDGHAIAKGHRVKKSDGKEYVLFDSIDIKLNLKNYSVKLEKLFNNDKVLGEAVNKALNENKKEIINALKPLAEKVMSRVLLDMANKITMHFAYEELFPL